MAEILDIKENPELKKDRDAQETADEMTTGYNFLLLNAQNKPGAWIKRWGKRWGNLKDLKPKHFQGNAIRWANSMRENGVRYPHGKSEK